MDHLSPNTETNPDFATFTLKYRDVAHLTLYICLLLVAVLNFPNNVSLYYEERATIISLGFIGIWRYSWWLTHFIRSLIFRYIIFPQRRIKAQALWNSGWRPNSLFVMMTTYNELPETTEKVLQTLIDECYEVGVPVKLFVGTGSLFDEQVIEQFFSKQELRIPFEVHIVRQKLPGKRYAIGETIRSIIKNGLKTNDPVIFMDGDTFFVSGCLRLCLPFFQLYPKMQALTTYETAIVKNGPLWIKKWLDMRFAQRDLTMNSYALSDKILTLTGRMSIFRGHHVLEPEFINIIEQDHLKHWLWGEYRFLSGDDKSTWYYLLKHKADMFYIPDATTVTIEYIKGSAAARMKENLRRWSGNTLRNGARAIALGPRTVGYFTWWCLIDQRLSIWTLLLGHMITAALAITVTPGFIYVSFVWIALTRFAMSFMLFKSARRIDLSFPFLIYINQLATTLIKIYILFRLPQQRWQNRGNQHSGFGTSSGVNLRNWVANYLTAFYCLCCLLLILFYLDVVSLPTIADIKTLF
jgi:glycosyltransferase Alg8